MGDTGIGALLTRLRTERGWTQQRVADEYNALEGRCTKTGKEMGRYERETRIPVPYTRRYLAKVFGVGVAVLDQAAAVSKRRRSGEGGTVRVQELVRQQAPPRSPAEAVTADAAAAADFARFIAQRNAAESVVEQMEADVAQLARAYVSHPLLELYVEIKQSRDGVFELLRGRQRPRQTADLYVAASRLCGLSAHVCLDLGDYAFRGHPHAYRPRVRGSGRARRDAGLGTSRGVPDRFLDRAVRAGGRTGPGGPKAPSEWEYHRPPGQSGGACSGHSGRPSRRGGSVGRRRSFP